VPDPTCFSSRQVCRLRVALLDPDTGAPDNGANNGYVSKGFVSIEIDPQISEGDEVEVKDGCGDICATWVDPDIVKRVNATINLCQLDAQLYWLIMGGTAFTESPSDDLFGGMLPAVADGGGPAVCLEWWTKAQDGASQATPESTGSLAAYYHFVIPKIRFSPGGTTFENGPAEFPCVGKGDENPNITANGPFDDWPAEIAQNGGITSPWGWWLDSALPDASCAFVNVTSAAS
jgi:hypothetical protein